ncbi:MAG: thiamine phosphate synthase [Alphaproteobacteria bacterium]|nr:thiamine phosphate synthase [Alphaproteobacteria bacterium]
MAGTGQPQDESADRIRTRLYLITPPRLDLDPFVDTLTAALEGGDVACLQLRLKDVPQEEIIEAARVLMPVCHAYDVAFLINDDASLAKEVEADGVHVGQEDTPYGEARRLLGEDAIVGVTCHDSRHLAMEAAEKGADYVAFGAFFPTKTKSPKASTEPEILAWWSEMMEIPCVAIGGITVENCRPLVQAGADFLAVAAGVWAHDKGPGEAVRQFNALFDEEAA